MWAWRLQVRVPSVYCTHRLSSLQDMDSESIAKRLEVLQERVAVLEGQKQEALAGQQGKGPKIVGDQHPSIKAVRAGAEGGLDVELVKAERDKALAEVAALKKTVAKHEYRIMHLIRALNEEENKHK